MVSGRVVKTRISFSSTAGMVQSERNLGTFASAYPVSLHYFDALRPVQTFMLHQFISVFGDAEKPLLQIAPDYRGIASFAKTFDHLLIGQHRLAARTPVDRGFGPVSQTGFIQFQEKPLRPFIIFRQAGNNLAAPIMDSAHGFQLAAHVFDILHGPGEGMNTPFDGRIFGRQDRKNRSR